ncbi:Polyketide synthase [Tolypocladium capitatum]|uniref:Polyketide synthase n=1 Tax=Tolypocladium capitatum TaxID=45235 RepID=A0A2K3Q4Q0_9HYPO|nr:Polyketide synthase [Tolypocladium capitatum]
MANQTRVHLIVFGDQAVPYHKELHGLLAKKESHTLAVFLAEAYKALKTEISRLPYAQGAQFPRSSTLAEFLVAYDSSSVASCALDSALVCLHQIASFISYITETNGEYPQPSSCCVIGRCIGLLVATAVSCSQNVIELLSLGPEFVVLAFRLGLLVQTRSESIATGLDKSNSYSMVVGGVDRHSASRLIDGYCESRGLSASARIYVSAIGHDSITVSGPPEHLRDFCAQNWNLRSAKVPISGLFHSSHLYADTDSETIAGAIGEDLRKKPARLDILSNSDGQKLDSKSCGGLIEAAVREVLSEQLRWDLVTEHAAAELAQSGASEVVILPFASGGVQTLATAVDRSGDKAVKVVDTTVRQEKESTRGKIAIVGFSGRYPEAENNQEFWDLLLAGLDVHKDIPKDRFDPWLYYDPTGKKKNTSGVTKGCFLKNPGLFDARFFGLSPREAEQSDPAQRLAMMTAYEAMEMAGFVPDATASSQRDRVGVFYGTASDDYRECNSGQDVDTYFVPGGSRAFLPARINYQWRFSGPSFDVDTACSSSLAAIHIACNCLWRGDCDTAFAGGTNVLTNPDNWAGLDRAHFLSRTGNCNTFDDGADGYCRSESVATVLLKRLEDAELDGDPIFGTILGAYTNHSAEAVSMTRPHSGAQRAIFSKIMTGAGVDNADVGYVEMHGTGTQHGDACEMDSVLSVFAPEGSHRAQDRPLYLGSTKANIGHAESASGVSSLIKVLLMMENSMIPPHVGIKTRINRKFPTDLAQRNVRIAFQPTRWTRPLDKPQGRRAFVNNFGAAGGNSSVLLEDAPLPRSAGQDSRPLHMVAVSAKSQSSLKRNIRALCEYLDGNLDVSVGSLSFTTTARRIHHGFRAIVSGTNTQDIRQALQVAEAKEGYMSTATANTSVGFCFSGQGSQYLSMGRELLQIPQFRLILMGLEDILRVQGFRSVLPIIDGSCTTPMDELAPSTLQLSITCLQMALGKLWKSLGITPRLVVGHSLGEYAALNIAGVLSDADTIHLVGTRARLLEEHCSVGTHTMLAVKAPAAKVASLITSRPGLEIACVNGPEETVVAGTGSDVESFADHLTRQSIKGTLLRVQFAFHSAQVEPMLEAFRHSCRSITFKDPDVPVISPLLGKTVAAASDFGSPAAYLGRHCRETVNFYQALQSASASDAISDKMVWVEIGPHPICLNMVKSTLGPRVRACPSLRRNESGWNVFISTLTALYECGLSVNWNEYHDGFKETLRVLRLPAYQWELKQFWIPYMYDWCLTKGDAPAQPHLTLGAPVEEPAKQIFTASVQSIEQEKHSGDETWITARSDIKHPDLLAALQGHRINDRPLCPSSVYADMALTLFTRLLEKSTLPDKSDLGAEVSNMVVDKTLLLNDESTQIIELKASATLSSRSATLTICSISKDGKITINHAKCNGSFTKKSQWTAEWKRRGFLVKSRIENLQHSLHDDSDSSVHLLKPGMFYKLFSSIVEYDDSFRGLRELIMRSSELECTAKVKFNTPAGEGDKWFCPPYWIESLGQITGFSLNGNDALDCQNQVFINHGWEKMRVLKALSPEMTYRTYVKMHTEDNISYSGDLYIFDSSEEIVGMYEGVTFNALNRKIFDRVLPRIVKAGQTPDKVLQGAPRAATVEKPEPVARRPSAQSDLPVPPKLEQDDMGPDLAVRVRSLISEEVGVPASELMDDDDLVVLGVDSLLALTMSDRIREDFDVTVDSTAFLSSLTVRDLIQRITGVETRSSDGSSAPSTPPSMDADGMVGVSTAAAITPLSDSSTLPMPVVSSNEKCFGYGMTSTSPLADLTMATPIGYKPTVTIPPATSVLLQGNAATADRILWLIPDGSGLATSYLQLPDVDAKSVAVYGLNSPFVKRTKGMSECTFADLTTAYLTEMRRRQRRGPYFLGGWSAGGICAYDAAQRLTAAGEDVARLILIDSPNPIGLQKLPARLYDDFDRLGIFGAVVGRKLPAWLLPHCLAFIDILHSYEPRPFVGPTCLPTWVIWAEEGVADDGSIEILPSDPPNVRWLLLKRTNLGPNGWDRLVGRDNMTIEVLEGANHFSMLKETTAKRVSAFISRAMARSVEGDGL